MTPKPNLHLIEGEVRDDCARCADLEDRLELARDEWVKVKREARRLKREAEDRHRSHKLRKEVESLFNLWREICRHPNSKLDYGPGSRFERILWGLTTYGYETCELAVRGAAHDPFTTKRRNGTVKRHDGIELVFRNSEKTEEMACRAPRAA